MGSDILYRCGICGSEDVEATILPTGKQGWWCNACEDETRVHEEVLNYEDNEDLLGPA